MTATGISTLLFDMDGTLIDSAPQLLFALNRSLDRVGARPLSRSEMLPMMGEGMRGLVARAHTATGISADPEETLGHLLGFYDAHCAANTSPFPGVVEALDGLSGQFRLAVCTNKPRDAALAVMERLGWTECFEDLSAGDDLPVCKPAPEPVWSLLQRMGVRPEQAALIGDTASDAGAAHAAGTRFYGVSYGYCKTRIGDLGALAILDDLRELEPLLATGSVSS